MPNQVRGATRTGALDPIAGLRNAPSRRERARQMLRSTTPLIRAGVGDAGGLRRGDGRRKNSTRPKAPKAPRPPGAKRTRSRRPATIPGTMATLLKQTGRRR